MYEKIWTEEEKEHWLAANDGEATHIVTFEPMYQVELCIPPWEQPERQIARSAVVWGKSMARVFDEELLGAAPVVAAHHEGNAMEAYVAVKPRPRLHQV
jgi:hypothetical protein